MSRPHKYTFEKQRDPSVICMSELLKQLSIKKQKTLGKGWKKKCLGLVSMIRDHQESHTRDLGQSFCVHFSQDESYLPILSLEGPEGDSPTVLSPWVRYSQTKCSFDVITSC